MNENEIENTSAAEQEPVPVVLKELPPVTFAWALQATKCMFFASLVWGMVVGAIITLFYCLLSMVK